MRPIVCAALAAVALAGAPTVAGAGEEAASGSASAQTQAGDAPGFEITANHVGISVPDLEASIDWYHRMLGFELVRRMSKDADPKMVFALMRHGSFNLELFQVEEGRDMPDYRRDPTADLYVHGVKHLAFQVKDAVAAAEELKRKGAKIVLGPVVGERTTYVFIADNAGIPFELIEFK